MATVDKSNPSAEDVARAYDKIVKERADRDRFQVQQTTVGGNRVDFVANMDIVKMFEDRYREKIGSELVDEKSIEKAYSDAHKRAIRSAYVYEENLFKRATANQKQEILKSRQAIFQKELEQVRERGALELSMHKEGSKAYQKALDDVIKQENEVMKKIAKSQSDSRKVQADIIKERQDESRARAEGRANGFVASKRAYAQTQAQAADEYRELAWQARQSGDQEAAKQYEAQSKEAAKQAAQADIQAQLLGGIGKALDSINAKMDAVVESAVKNISTYLPQFSTRLQGSGKDFDSIYALVKKNLGMSPFIKQTAYLENISKGVTQGIAYNIESRAYLESIKDRIADTFNAFDANMSRLIRLQQSDSSRARLGMESSMISTLNAMFSDTSYMSTVYDTVSGALLDASAQLSKNESIAFEYTVQKWLGSLYSLGLSDTFVSQVAQAINYLGTGNVQALAGNTSMQALLAMSASRAGVPYGETLTGGLTAESTNKILKSMVEYLQDIAGDTNKVVKSAYGNIFGFSLSDLQAIRNLTSGDIATLYKGGMDYYGAVKTLKDQIKNIEKRTSFQMMVENLFDDAVYTMGSAIADNPAIYTLWKTLSMIQGATGGMHLPAISVVGNMVDLSQFTIEGLAKSGIVGLSSLSLVPAILGAMAGGSDAALRLGAWGFQGSTTRGGGLDLLSALGGMFSGFNTGVSASGYVASGSGADIKRSSTASATEEAQETAKITNAGMETEHTFDDLYKALFTEQQAIAVKFDKDVTSQLEAKLSKIIESIAENSILRLINNSGDNQGIPVMVINTETPVDVSIKNTAFNDVLNAQSLLAPSAGSAMPGLGLGLGF